MQQNSIFACAGMRMTSKVLTPTWRFVAGVWLVVTAGAKEVLMAWLLQWNQDCEGKWHLSHHWLSTRPPPHRSARALRCVVPRCAVTLRCAELCCAMLCCAVLCCAVLCRAMLCHTVPCHAVPCCAMLYSQVLAFSSFGLRPSSKGCC